MTLSSFSKIFNTSSSKNALNATLKKMGRPDKTIVFSVLIIDDIGLRFCCFLVTRVGRPTFLEGKVSRDRK
jgi:hypothetical protein